uniref:VPS9 domain-containing protein n=1 Tax=Dendroctonus ponderosae TaxID=77166 RepID=A0AAR5PKC5_DENPD
MNHSFNLWIHNRNVEVLATISEPTKKIANIGNHLFLLTSSNVLHEGFLEQTEEQSFVSFRELPNQLQAVDIQSHDDSLFVIDGNGSVLKCNEQLEVLKEINLLEEYQCALGHSTLTYKVKVKSLAIGKFGALYVSESNQLWGSGDMPQIGITSDVPRKVAFFSGRIVHGISVGADFAVVVVGKPTVETENSFCDTLFAPACQLCSSNSQKSSDCSPTHLCPLGMRLQSDDLDNTTSEELEAASANSGVKLEGDDKTEKNIIFRNTEAAKDFLTRQISRMSSVGEEYLMECTEKPTRIFKENMTNVATLVYEGVKTVGDKVATLSRHVSSSSEHTNLSENSQQRKNSKEDFLLSVSQSTSERDLQDLEVQDNVDVIVNQGKDLLNREVWMWGNVKHGCIVFLGVDTKMDLPVILSILSKSGVSKISLQNYHACALTLDGRVFLWGRNNDHQVTLENKADQSVPKLFVCNMNERVIDATCGDYFTVILTTKNNVTYFGRSSQSYQTIYHRFMSESEDSGEKPVELFSNFLSSSEYSVLNVGPKCEESFNNFVVKEQNMLEEMLCVHQQILRLLIKKSNDLEDGELYDLLCKNYRDFLHFLAVNIESLLQYRNGLIGINDVTIVKNYKEFLLIYQNYVDCIQNVSAISGFAAIATTIAVSPQLYSLRTGTLKEKTNNDQDIAVLLTSPAKRVGFYMDFFRKFCNIDYQTRWKDFMEYVDCKGKEAEKTRIFWMNAGSTIKYMMEPKRRLICDSQSDPINLQSSSRFSSHRFVLFSDIFAHISGSSPHLHALNMIWLDIPHHESLHLICLKLPEETLTLVAPDGVTKNTWYHALQHAIKAALNKTDLFQPPLARNGKYTFTKPGVFKDAQYTGRWLNAKMHGSGKMVWSDGRSYTGQFSNNSLSGYGSMDIPNFGTYEGDWKDNKQNGYGTFTYSSKDIYKGYFKDGQFHGHGLLRKGTFMANSASLYIGEWDAGRKCGYGVMDEISTGEKYLGCWSDHKEGSGLIVTSEGTYYEGNFHNDVLSGHGVMVLDDGTHYDGEFKGTGILGGKGAVTLPSGHVIEGHLIGSLEEGIKINAATLRKTADLNQALPKSFGQLCTAPANKWKALFKHCREVLGLDDGAASVETPRIWQNVAVYLTSASTLKRRKGDDGSLQNSLNNLDVIPPFGRDKITIESYMEIRAYLNRAFESPLHPLGSLLNNLCEAYISSYSGKVHPILVNHAIMEVIDVAQRVYGIIVYLFPALPSCESEYVLNRTDDDYEIINYQSLLYPLILPKVYNCLCTLLSLKNESQEKQYKKVLIEWNKLSDRSLMSGLSVEKKFLHLDQCINLSDKSCAFVEAIETLQQIITVFLPIEKLSVIRSTVKKMTPVAQELLGDAYVWNMDDLFPLFLYVVVRARIPHLGAELEFMEHFMDRNLENGELGIMFTTLKACYQQILQDKSVFIL